MKEISSKITRNHIAIFFIVANFIGLFSSRILMSNGMIWFFTLAFIPNSALIFLTKNNTHPLTFKKRLRGLIDYSPFLAQTFIVIIALFGCFYSSDLAYAQKTLFTYSPFLFMPIAFGAIQAFSKKEFIAVLYLYCLVVFVAATAILINYFLHFDAMNEGLKQGHAIRTPYHEHIRFSLMICFTICILLYLRMNNYSFYNEKLEKKLQILISIILIIYIHILSVRSGILSLYLCLLVFAIYLILYYKKYLLGSLFILFVFIAPFISYYTIDSVKNKINYMIWDIQQLQNNRAKNYSDAERIVSIIAGIKIAKSHLLLGVGTGDIKEEMNKVYESDYAWIDKANRKMPHNQWVWLCASNGLLGVFTLAFSIIYVLLYKKNYKNILLISFFIISISSFLYEHTLQTQVGVAYYVLSLLIILNYLRGKETVDENRI